MGKKKAIKLATATAIAASAFVAVAPTQSEAATSSVDKAITKASSAMLKAFNTYNKTAREDQKLPALSTIKKDVKAAQDAYAAATKEIASKGGTKTQKAALTKKLDTNKKYLDRAELYLKAVTTNLHPAKNAFTDAVAGGTQSKVLSAQKAYQAKIAEFEANVKKVYGPDARNLLTAKYADAANKLVSSVDEEMKVYEAYKEISGLVGKDLEAAYKGIKDVEKETANVAKLDSKLAKNINSAVVKINKKFEDAVKAAVSIEGITDGEKTEEETKTITVKATKGSEIKVTLNEKEVVANENGSYTLKLQEGSNKVAVESTVYGVKTELSKEITSNQTPAVKSVSAINAKTITVEFSKAVDAKTLKAEDKFDVITVVTGENAEKPGTLTQELSVDGKTLTIKAGTGFFKGEYTVKVPFEIVKDTSGKFVQAVNQKITANDTAAPLVTSAKATVKTTTDKVKSVTLTFDEEVSSIDNIKIDGVNYTNPEIVGNTVTLDVNDLDATKAYNVTVVNAEDAAGNIKEEQVAPLSVTVDNVTPAITSVVPAGENKVKVTFNKELASEPVISGKVGSYTANVVKDVEVDAENSKQYVVTLDSNYLFKSGNSDSVTLTIAKEALADKLGNTNAAEIVRTVSVSKDAAAPSVSKVVTTSTNGKVTGFTVTYNEEVTGIDTTKVSIVNSKGEILIYSDVVASQKLSEDKKSVEFTLGSEVKADKYGFDFAEAFVTDTALANNKAPKYAFTVDVAAVGAPVETSFKIAGAEAAANVITVDFGEGNKVKATGTGSALNPSAYKLNGVTLPSSTSIAFAKVDGKVDQTKVVITLPEGFVSKSDTNAIFRVTGVQTLDNKVNNSFIKEVEVTDNTAPEAKSFVATDLHELTVTYSEALVGTALTDVSDELKLVNSQGTAIDVASATVVEGKLVLSFADTVDAATVSKLTTVAAKYALSTDIKDAADNAQKAGVTVNK